MIKDLFYDHEILHERIYFVRNVFNQRDGQELKIVSWCAE